MAELSFRQFLVELQKDEEPPDLYQAASDELNTNGEVGIQVFDWIPFDDGIFRFGQTFQVTKQDDNVVWIKPISGKSPGDKEGDMSIFKLNVMKCAQRDPNTGKMMQVQCAPLRDTKEFPIDRKQWRKMVNKPFQQANAGGVGIAAPGELPGM